MKQPMRDVFGAIFITSTCFLLLLALFGMPVDQFLQNPITLAAVATGASSGAVLLVAV